jgi:hypothetical protein
MGIVNYLNFIYNNNMDIRKQRKEKPKKAKRKLDKPKKKKAKPKPKKKSILSKTLKRATTTDQTKHL